MQPIIEKLMFWQWDAIVQSFLLLLGVSLIWVLIHKRVSPQWGIALFLLVFLKAIVPVSLPVPDMLAQFIPMQYFSHVMTPKQEPLPIVESPVLHEVSTTEPSWMPSPMLLPVDVPEQMVPVVQPLKETPVSEIPATIAETAKPTPIALPQPELEKSVTATSFSISWGVPVLCGWFVVVLGLFGRLFLRQMRFVRRIHNARPIPASELAINVENLCRSLKLNNIPVYETTAVHSPAVYGLFRPVILLPEQLSQTVSTSELHWILLHELAHVRRFDHWFVFATRMLTILFFFNPVLWISRRMMDRLREFACDDFATFHSGSSAIEASEAFMKILKRVAKNRSTQTPTLAVFDPRNATFQRMQRLLDTNRKLHVRFGGGSILIWLLLAVLLLPRLTAKEITPISVDDLPQLKRMFTFTIVDPQKTPLPNVSFKYRVFPKPDDWPSLPINADAYHAKTDTDGTYVFRWNAEHVFDHFEVKIATPGYAPYLARWEYTPVDPIPKSYTVRLEPAKTLGGQVVDEQGEPIPNVKVTISQMEMRDQIDRDWRYETMVQTDQNGTNRSKRSLDVRIISHGTFEYQYPADIGTRKLCAVPVLDAI